VINSILRFRLNIETLEIVKMKRTGWIVLGVSALQLAAGLALLGPGKKEAQRLFLKHARVGDTVTWGDVFRARKTIVENEPGSKCIKVGRDHVNGQDVIYVFTLLQLYELKQDASGKWGVASKGPYNP
jgi:hypothetical protein